MVSNALNMIDLALLMCIGIITDELIEDVWQWVVVMLMIVVHGSIRYTVGVIKGGKHSET